MAGWHLRSSAFCWQFVAKQKAALLHMRFEVWKGKAGLSLQTPNSDLQGDRQSLQVALNERCVSPKSGAGIHSKGKAQQARSQLAVYVAMIRVVQRKDTITFKKALSSRTYKMPPPVLQWASQQIQSLCTCAYVLMIGIEARALQCDADTKEVSWKRREKPRLRGGANQT